MSLIHFFFCTNQNTLSKYVVDVSIFDKCDHNSIFGKVNIRVLQSYLELQLSQRGKY